MRYKFSYCLLIITAIISAAACKKEDSFINEDAVGTGMHYYPEIYNTVFVDTLTGKAFPDTLFSEGQRVVFEADFVSQDSIEVINLYATPPDSARRKVQSVAYDTSLFSEVKQADTVLLSYQVPDSLQQGVQIRLEVEVVTVKTLAATHTAYLPIR